MTDPYEAISAGLGHKASPGAQSPGDLLMVTPGAALHGEIGRSGDLPGDKSLSHRAALLAAMAEGESRIENFLVSGVTHAMLDALSRLGVAWRLDGRSLTVQGAGLLPAPDGALPVRMGATLDCGNSATPLRLLAGALAAWNVDAVLDGSPGLRRRPMGRIVEPLKQMGVDIGAENGCAPLHLRRTSRPLQGMALELPVASAQVKSCLLLAALAAAGPTTVSEPGPSRDHTERMLAALGATVACNGYRTTLTPPSPLRLPPLRMMLPGDMSAAAFLIVAALITPGSEITVRGVGLNPTRTGLLDTLLEMGADIVVIPGEAQGGEPYGDVRVRASALHGVTVGGERVVRMIDEFPIFAVAAAYAVGTTTVRDAEELRHKESDRITALGGELRRLGVDFAETGDGFVIHGGPVQGGEVEAHGDHRLALSLAVAGLASRAPVQVRGAQMMAESFPGFSDVLRSLGGRLA